MTLAVFFHALAEVELSEAAAFYSEARSGLGDAFITAVEDAVGELAASPLAGMILAHEVRAWVVGRFPYRVLYRVCGDYVRVLAIAHDRRRPLYWSGRE